MFGGVFFLLSENRLFPTRFAHHRMGVIFTALTATLFQGIGYSLRKIGVQSPIDPVFAALLDTLSALLVYIIILGYLGRLKHYIDYYKSHLNLYIISAGFVMAAAVFLFFDAVLEAPVSTVSVIMGAQPVFVALLASIFMKKMEQLTWVTFVSAILVSSGVILLSL